MFDFSGQNKNQMTGNTGFNFGGSPQSVSQPVQQKVVQQPAANKGYTGFKALAAKTADILLNRPRQAILAAATYDAKNNNGFLQDLKGGWEEIKAALRGERRDATGSKYLEAKGFNAGLGRDLAGGAIDILATPAFNPLMKAGSRIAAPIQNTTARRIAGSSAGGALFGTADAFAAEQPAGEIANRAITDAILFGGVDTALMGLGKIGRKAIGLSKPKEQFKTVEPATKEPAFNFAVVPESKTSKEKTIKGEFIQGLRTVNENLHQHPIIKQNLDVVDSLLDSWGTGAFYKSGTPVRLIGFRQNRGTQIPGTGTFYAADPRYAGGYVGDKSIGNLSTLEVKEINFKNPLIINGDKGGEGHRALVSILNELLPSNYPRLNLLRKTMDLVIRGQGEQGYQLLDKEITKAAKYLGYDGIIIKKGTSFKGEPGYSNLTEIIDLTSNVESAMEPRLPQSPSKESIYNETRNQLQELFNRTNLTGNIKDISGISSYMRDPYRNLERAFGQNFGEIERMIMQPFDQAKAANIQYQEKLLQDLKSNIVDRLGIKKGSRDSALVQKFGEGGYEKVITDPKTGVKSTQWVKYTWDDLVKDVGPVRAQQIAEADAWFRQAYDKLLDDVNKAKEAIYPNAEERAASIAAKIEDLKTPGKYTRKAQQEKIQALEWELNTLRNNPRRRSTEDTKYMQTLVNKIEEIKNDPVYTAEGRRSMIEHLEREYEKALLNKRVPKRKDYYRHFKELTDSYQGLKNIFDSPANIDPALEGISYQTMPRSKWASFAQRRTGGAAYDLDAVGGFLDYVPAASRAIHIDPHISRFEALADELADATLFSKNANNLIRHLRELAQNLAGKTNPVDRFMQDFLGRKTFNVLNWINSRIKANTVLGNAGTTVAQMANIPQGIAFAKQHSINGLKRTMKSIFVPNDAIKQSAFLTERFGNKMYRQFDDKLLDQPKNFAIWIMQTADRIATEFIWNSCYEKALAERIANPVRFADINTRKLVAGRGIGEVPLAQQAKLFQLVAPFQVEVGNLWHVMSDTIKAKDFTGLAVLSVALWMFNRGVEQIRGTGVTFDPLDALYDALTDEEMTPMQRVGRLAGEVFSNIPGGQTVAAITMDDYKREKFFGDEDPTRYGTGILVAKGAQNPLFRLVPPFGGTQLEKTYKGLKGIGQEGVYTPDGSKLKYPVNLDATNIIKGLMFGPSGFREARPYYEEGGSPLTEKQTQQVQQGGSGQYMQIVAGRSKRALNSQLAAIDRDDTLTPMEKAKRKAELRQKYREQQK